MWPNCSSTAGCGGPVTRPRARHGQLRTWKHAARPGASKSYRSQRQRTKEAKNERELMSAPGVALHISPPELKLLQTLVYQECGMYFDERRMDFLQNRL